MTIEKLRQLEAAATPRPWEVKPLAMTGASLLTLPHPLQWSVQLPTENAALIAAMRNALPDLIAAVEALRDLLCEMSDPVWDDPRIDYEEVQITKGEREKARAILKRLGVE